MENIAILVLREISKTRNAYGYVIQKALKQAGIKITHQHVYKLLAKLTQEKLIQSQNLYQDEKPDRVVYNLTLSGEKAIKELMPSLKRGLLNEFDLALITREPRYIEFALSREKERLKELTSLANNPCSEVQSYVQFQTQSNKSRITALKEILH